MEYYGKSERCRVRVIATTGWLAKYNGQECDATFYDEGVNPQIDTEQLKPPLPRWQSTVPENLERIK